MESVQTVENFYGVYLLFCLNPKYTGRTYIGYTVDPNRRIKQHNKGKTYGGAWKTSNKGPWTMVMIIHGFPNDISALRFEWAWQHPHSSRRLLHVPKKKAREKVYDFCLRVLSEMLQVGPWNKLPLTIRWLNQEFYKDFAANKSPPMHMPISYGPVISKKLTQSASQISRPTVAYCYKCSELIDNDKQMSCLNSNCSLVCHVICLSTYFLADGEYVPVEGKCPKCDSRYLWGDLVRKYKGCYNNIDVQFNTCDIYCSNEEDS